MTPPNKVITWTIEHAIVAPRLGLDVHQKWTYAPNQEMVNALPYTRRAAVLFLAMAVLTLLICGAAVDLRQVALLGGLFMLPFLVSMAGVVPTLKGVTPAEYAGYQVKALPVLALPVLALAFGVLRGLPRLPRALVLILMGLFMGGYVLIGLLPDEQKRNAIEGMVQVGMIAWVFGLALFTRIRSARKTRAGAEGEHGH